MEKGTVKSAQLLLAALVTLLICVATAWGQTPAKGKGMSKQAIGSKTQEFQVLLTEKREAGADTVFYRSPGQARVKKQHYVGVPHFESWRGRFRRVGIALEKRIR